MRDQKLPFIIIAGSPNEKDELMVYADVDYKAEILLNGKSMITRVLEAIRDSNYYSYIVIVSLPQERVLIPEGIPINRVEFYSDEGKHMDKIINAAIHLREKGKKDPTIFPADSHHTVNLSGDIPGLNGEILQRFIHKCGNRESSFYHTAVEESIMENAFPNNGRSFIKVEKKNYCAGDLNMADLEYAEQLRPRMNSISSSRKNFMKALFKASPWTFTKLLAKRIKFKDVEKLMTKIFKIRSRLIISQDAEVAFDVDKPFQLDLMKKYINDRELPSNESEVVNA
ncbi:MAG: hypothetical protein ACXAC2_09360 [Candidatus Kariarchaeaceae archaeon]